MICACGTRCVPSDSKEGLIKLMQRTTPKIAKKKKLTKRLAENWQMYIFLLIPLIWLLIFKYYPMYGAQIAFRKYKIRLGITGSPWVGLDNFIKFFKSYQFSRTVGNTLFLSIVGTVISFPIPIFFALLLNSVRNRKWKSAIENITYMPHFISTVVLVGMMKRIFDINTGMIHNMLSLVGVNFHNDLFSGTVNFRMLYICSGIWQGTGWGSIIYMAALSSVDPELHEAATIDGASRWARVRYIDFPTILPTIVVMLILSAGSVMSIGFDKAYLMQNDTNLAASEVISTYVYKVGFLNDGGNFSYSSAIGMFNSIINLIMMLTVNFISNKINGSGIW